MLVTAPMETPLFSCLFSLLILLTALPIHAFSTQCLTDHQSLLLQLKNELLPNALNSTRLLRWSPNSDCCSWEGVTCKEGRVTGLDLMGQGISAGIENSTLFNLQSLESLDLSFNDFDSPFPARIGNLTSLNYLNLTDAGFVGQVPSSISRLIQLVSLRLSTESNMKLEKPSLFMLIQNLTKLEELYLDGVNMSSTRNQWCEFISSSLPHLRVLSLSYCDISGPIDHSLMNLQALSEIRLDGNNLSSPVPLFLANLSRLVSLSLRDCELYGEFPKEIFKVPTLQTLDISFNELLQGSLPEFPQNNALQTLVLSGTNFSGPLPTSIDNLRNLSRLDLSWCQFNGTLPNSMVKLTKLVSLDLSRNNFTGPVPSFKMSKNLSQIILSHNDLNGEIPSAHWEGFLNLVAVRFQNNSFNGSIPSSLFKLSSIEEINLSDNQFSGKLEFPNPSSSMLASLDLSNNRLEGPIPISIFNLRNLTHLYLSSNKLNGIELDMFQGLPNLEYLDLSDNQIHGVVPNWIWEVGNGSLFYLNLSHNYLVGMQEPYSIPNSMEYLDLHQNQLQGKIPFLPLSALYIDFSSNIFTGSFPSGIGYNLSSTVFFSLSNNSLMGVIPESICMASSLQVLDLSKNSLNGRVPECLSKNSNLGVLNLGNNNLSGPIPNTFLGNCSLKTLDLNGNRIQGQISKSLANCYKLEVLNLGNNNLIDEFPCLLMNISSLRVLVLQSNKLYGSIECLNANITWAMLQIFDLAHNNFSGKLPGQSFVKWKAMMGTQPKLDFLQFESLSSIAYYADSVTVTIKGRQMNLVKILTIFTSIDLSSNKFDGPIPEEIGELISLYSLNLSSNSLSGKMPSTLGNLREVESLDLSSNHLTGNIPPSLAKLNFLSLLNLSFNQLVGNIPSGNQIQTFSADSFMGNEGLCGPPLIHNYTNGVVEPNANYLEDRSGIDWDFLSVEIGFIVGFGMLVGPLVFCRRWRKWYFECVDEITFMICPLSIWRFYYRRQLTNQNKRRRH